MITETKRSYDDANELPCEDSNELINQVIKRLSIPSDAVPTNVSSQFSNDLNLNNEVQAYAKIAGRTWTYYVKTLKVIIGRNTESHSNNAGGGSNSSHDADHVDIDLGPSKVVSRRHALIQYNLEQRRWELFVYGRNGVKVDGVRLDLPYGAPYVLGSGNILDIGGTQMMFILPDAAPSIADSFLQGLRTTYFSSKRPHSGFFGNGTSLPGEPMTSTFGTGNVRAFQMYNKSDNTLLGSSRDPSNEQDYSKDEAKDMKPPYSYATMITQAILSNPQGVLSLSEIYDWIASHFAYYRYSKQGWQNSIRHNLSLNKAFEKVPRRPNEPGKGMKWQISESYRRDFLRKWRDGTLNKGKRGTSVARQLQLHLMRNHALPESGRIPVATVPTHHRRKSSRMMGNGLRSSESESPPKLERQHSEQDEQSEVTSGSNSPIKSLLPHKEALSYITAAATATVHGGAGVASASVMHDIPSLGTGASTTPNLSPSGLAGQPSNLSSPIKPLVLPDFRTDYSSASLLAKQDSSEERPTPKGLTASAVAAAPSTTTATKKAPVTPEHDRFTKPDLQADSSLNSSQSRPSVNSSPALWNYVQFSTPLAAPGTAPRAVDGSSSRRDDVEKNKKANLESPLRDRKPTTDESKLGDLKDVDLIRGFKG
ncbi:hypothetical protein FOA43_001290 [Brettanomyces nanus]|uniref:Uncharacterized protein n=1 Tax=Eeniella nana TaxID=13502 RepID=A0A875S3W5_EENNA|nr:uncharacterized protein FOA43_001290 [Brettanomyces nanus]QPG73974.1 hypothetical protein FOA43_001290 [Brettanomyces nanus]